MSKKASSNVPEHALQAYDKLIANLDGVERKGATMPYTSLNGHMFSFIAADGSFALRLPEESRMALIEKYSAEQAIQHGVVLKEYVIVPEKLLADTRTMKKLMRTSYEYIQSLKPKATKTRSTKK